MFIDSLKLTNVRTFVKNELRFVHPDAEFRSRKEQAADVKEKRKWPVPKPKLPNVNLLLGDNGSGKSTVLQAIVLAALGPAGPDAKLPLLNFVRFRQSAKASAAPPNDAEIQASFLLHPQDGAKGKQVDSRLRFARKGELERLEFLWREGDFDRRAWDRVFESENDAFFCVAYGATRRVDTGDSSPMIRGGKTPFLRGQRLQSIFQDSFALFPLSYWLPELQSSDLERYEQVVQLLNRMLGPGNFRFTGEMREREYLFERGGVGVPFRSLSDGYRSFIAWVADLLYHVCYGCPSDKRLTESSGVVLVDEIDLHLHPKWQMHAIRTVAQALPRMQFVFTSHSPLIVGSLEWMNIITLKTPAGTNRTTVKRLRQGIHGLDADQILLTDFFGLKTTRAKTKTTQLDTLRTKARSGDRDAARKMILAMAQGTEEDEA